MEQRECIQYSDLLLAEWSRVRIFAEAMCYFGHNCTHHGWGSPSPLFKVYEVSFLGGGGKQLATQIHLGLKLKRVKLYHWSPYTVMPWMGTTFNFLPFMLGMLDVNL